MDKVTIVGLMDNSNVKITDLNGNIIYQTKSLGGKLSGIAGTQADHV
ncbi:hypothetical protein NXX37_17600 [Parabacteroides distasonis]|nr:hypothetical protein NXX37_17600 [Parabacteroides distasonis]